MCVAVLLFSPCVSQERAKRVWPDTFAGARAPVSRRHYPHGACSQIEWPPRFVCFHRPPGYGNAFGFFADSADPGRDYNPAAFVILYPMKNLPQIREISTISFNERVLQEAEDLRNPLLERLRFLGIFSSNMDEFFKVRVASIHRRIELGKDAMGDVLEAVSEKARELDERFQQAYENIVASLAEAGSRILTETDIRQEPQDLRDWVKAHFRSKVLPRLVPIICSKRLPFPRIADGGLYLGIKMWAPKPRFAILEIPSTVPRFVELPNGHIMYIDDVIRYRLDDIFYIFKYDRIGAYQFKISRDAELDIDNDFSEGYVRKMERVLAQRKGGRPTRFVYDATMPDKLRMILLKELKVSGSDTNIAGGRYHNMRDLIKFPLRKPELAFEHMNPAAHPQLDVYGRPIMQTIRERDVLVTYPYQSFDHVIRLLREAAVDPKVDAIKMTLYRTAEDSQVVNALYNAARNGKDVFVSVELQARFDEENNIRVSEKLQEVGVKVVFGVPPMKVHSKLLLIERRKKLITGLSTGNFNESTGRLYVDSMLFTADPAMGREVALVFDYLDTAARLHTMPELTFDHLMVSPFSTRNKITALIRREADKGGEGYIFLKVNHLTDKKTIAELRKAANAGVKMDLIVRTTYAMLPHENVRAISILDRYLEHQRIYIFGRGGDRVVYMSSADLMERNLDWRIEVGFPILDPALAREVWETMEIQIRDNFKARILDEAQSNRYVGQEGEIVRTQYETHNYYYTLAARHRTVAEDLNGGTPPSPQAVLS